VAGVRGRAAYELVVHRHTAHAELEQRRQVAFDVGGEHAGRRAGGAEPDATLVNEPYGDAAGSKLVGDRAADDTGSHDGDLHITDSSWWLVAGGWW
jgi:hypothetical protein